MLHLHFIVSCILHFNWLVSLCCSQFIVGVRHLFGLIQKSNFASGDLKNPLLLWVGVLPARERLLWRNICAVWVYFYVVALYIVVIYSNSVQVDLNCLVYLLVAALSVDVFVFWPCDLAYDNSNTRVDILCCSNCIGMLTSLTVLERRCTLTLKSLYAYCSLRDCISVREQSFVSDCGRRAKVLTILQSGIRLLWPWDILLWVPPQTRRLFLLSFWIKMIFSCVKLAWFSCRIVTLNSSICIDGYEAERNLSCKLGIFRNHRNWAYWISLLVISVCCCECIGYWLLSVFD